MSKCFLFEVLHETIKPAIDENSSNTAVLSDDDISKISKKVTEMLYEKLSSNDNDNDNDNDNNHDEED